MVVSCRNMNDPARHFHWNQPEKILKRCFCSCLHVLPTTCKCVVTSIFKNRQLFKPISGVPTLGGFCVRCRFIVKISGFYCFLYLSSCLTLVKLLFSSLQVYMSCMVALQREYSPIGRSKTCKALCLREALCLFPI